MINDGDKIIREQMGSIEAAPEHVVFDKEGAWGKLQGRLEPKKPALLLPFPYRWAAVAAVLLLVASIALLYRQPEEKVVAKTTNKNSPMPQPRHVEIALPLQKTAPPIAETPKHKPIPKKETNETRPSIIETNTPQETIVVVPPEEKHEAPVAAVPKMKVVHINELMSDLDREREEQAESSKHVAGGRTGFFLIKSVSSPSLYEDNLSPQPFKIRFTQN